MPKLPPDPEVLAQHAAFARSIARGLLGDADLADDVAQESMLAALRRPPRGKPRTWLGAVARPAVRGGKGRRRGARRFPQRTMP